jgi:hypothetical protein
MQSKEDALSAGRAKVSTPASCPTSPSVERMRPRHPLEGSRAPSGRARSRSANRIRTDGDAPWHALPPTLNAT